MQLQTVLEQFGLSRWTASLMTFWVVLAASLTRKQVLYIILQLVCGIIWKAWYFMSQQSRWKRVSCISCSSHPFQWNGRVRLDEKEIFFFIGRATQHVVSFFKMAFTFYFKNIYLFGCTGSYLWHLGSLLQDLGSSSCTREWKLVWTLNWKLEVLTIGPSGKSLKISLLLYLWLLKLWIFQTNHNSHASSDKRRAWF